MCRKKATVYVAISDYSSKIRYKVQQHENALMQQNGTYLPPTKEEVYAIARNICLSV